MIENPGPAFPSAPSSTLAGLVIPKEEAPYAYKEITPVIETVEEAGIARRVARL